MTSYFSYLLSVLKHNGSLAGMSLSEHRHVYNEWKHQIESGKYPIDFEIPWITVVAKNHLEKMFGAPSQIKRVFEYGTGGSSMFFLGHGSELISVEHDREWFELVKKKVEERGYKGWEGNFIEAEETNRNHSLLDIANPSHYYSDDAKFKKHSFEKYATAIDKYPDAHFDLVLVDGRSRPSCVAHSIPKIKVGGYLILDNAERTYYLAKNPGVRDKLKLVFSGWGAVVCYDLFSKTNIYEKVRA